MRTVQLHGKKAAGLVALVSDEDYDMVSRHRWHIAGEYVATNLPRNGGPSRKLYLHTLIAGIKMVDHANGSKLDCQRHNLRPVTNALNMANSAKRLIATSRFKGVYWQRSRSVWAARIKIDGRHHWLGRFADEADAARAYDAAARSAWGEFARLNLPGESCDARGAAE